MQTVKKRHDGRLSNQLRPLKASYNIYGYALSSVLFEVGNTKVLCSVTIQNGVPHWMRGKNSGWLTAEYAMLPTATVMRKPREISTLKKNSRCVEISRLISRALRSVVDLEKIGERTITIDCDVLQADGGTRTACISAAYVALENAINQLRASGEISGPILKDAVGAISVGLMQGEPLLDIDYAEDSIIDADYNFVITKSGNVIEIQGTAEKQPITWEQFEQLRLLAIEGMRHVFAYFDQSNTHTIMNDNDERKTHKVPLFSLKNRLNTIIEP